MEIHVSLSAETLVQLGPIAITNSMLTMFVVMAAILLVFGTIARGAKFIPGRGQGVIEMIVEFILGLVEGTAGKRIGRRIFPLIAGIFIFVLFANLSGVLPGVGTIVLVEGADEHDDAGEATLDVTEIAAESTPEGDSAAAAAADASDDEDDDIAAAATTAGDDDGHHGEERIPLFRPATADLNMTLAMSLLTFTVVQVAGISAHGVIGRVKHMADPPFILPIEIISELSRIISLSARLFGNVFAGEVLLAVMYAMANAIKIAIIPAVFPVVFIGLEVLFGTIQALVFALLTLIYITLAAAGHDDHAHEDAHDHAPADATTTTRGAAAPAGD